jgi:hypothetical protein
MLLLLMNEADCLDLEHRRTAGATGYDTGAGALSTIAVESFGRQREIKPDLSGQS